MKKIAVFVLLAFSLFSCSVKDILPDLGAEAAGTYTAWYFQQGTTKLNLPTSSTSLSITLTRASRITANYTLTAVVNGKSTSSTGVFSLDVDKDGTTIIRQNGSDLGYLEGKELTIDGNFEGVKTVIYADKK